VLLLPHSAPVSRESSATAPANEFLKISLLVHVLPDAKRSLTEPCKDTDEPLLKLGEEDVEALETDQLTVQGMLAHRFVKQFLEEVSNWQQALSNVSDVFLLFGEIQRTWSYLEPLFIHSEEVKRQALR
jgi:hypothetical protein